MITATNGHRDGTKIAAAASALEAINKTKGKLTPTLVVEAAKSKSSPLHGYFTWENNKAAQNYRLLEASMLIRTVRIRVSSGENQITAPAYMLPVRGHGNYLPTETVIQSEELTSAMMSIARTELAAFKKKYGRIEKLSGLWPVVDQILQG